MKTFVIISFISAILLVICPFLTFAQKDNNLNISLSYNHIGFTGPGIQTNVLYQFDRFSAGASYQFNSIRSKNSNQTTRRLDYVNTGILVSYNLINYDHSQLNLSLNFRKFFLRNYVLEGNSYFISCEDCPYDSPSGEPYYFPAIYNFQIGTEVQYLYNFSKHFSFIVGCEAMFVWVDNYDYIPYKFSYKRYMEPNFAANAGFVYHVKPL